MIQEIEINLSVNVDTEQVWIPERAQFMCAKWDDIQSCIVTYWWGNRSRPTVERKFAILQYMSSDVSENGVNHLGSVLMKDDRYHIFEVF